MSLILHIAPLNQPSITWWLHGAFSHTSCCNTKVRMKPPWGKNVSSVQTEFYAGLFSSSARSFLNIAATRPKRKKSASLLILATHSHCRQHPNCPQDENMTYNSTLHASLPEPSRLHHLEPRRDKGKLFFQSEWGSLRDIPRKQTRIKTEAPSSIWSERRGAIVSPLIPSDRLRRRMRTEWAPVFHSASIKVNQSRLFEMIRHYGQTFLFLQPTRLWNLTDKDSFIQRWQKPFLYCNYRKITTITLVCKKKKEDLLFIFHSWNVNLSLYTSNLLAYLFNIPPPGGSDCSNRNGTTNIWKGFGVFTRQIFANTCLEHDNYPSR